MMIIFRRWTGATTSAPSSTDGAAKTSKTARLIALAWRTAATGRGTSKEKSATTATRHPRPSLLYCSEA